MTDKVVEIEIIQDGEEDSCRKRKVEVACETLAVTERTTTYLRDSLPRHLRKQLRTARF